MNQPEKRDLALLAVQHARAHTRSETVKNHRKQQSSELQLSLFPSTRSEPCILDGRSDLQQMIRKRAIRKVNAYSLLL